LFHHINIYINHVPWNHTGEVVEMDSQRQEYHQCMSKTRIILH